ncbi:MAG: hypothetical protein N2117_05390 [Anaerolineales bacterium]|nr:hypothetical protein [Anaerolineales bacterium]MCX7754664.1 hypothetical protein [Anaerolineales bacterium]MDW8278326.1 hypothetical protein [Anaerolineales bacterium]
MPANKKNEPQFKLNYFDILKGVLFPGAGKPPTKTPPAAPPPTSGISSAQPRVSSNVAPPQPARNSSAPIQGEAPRPATRPPAQTAPAPKPQTPGFSMRAENLSNAFFRVSSILSFIINIILIVVILILARELFALKAIVGDHLLGGLYRNFQLMDAAHIRTTITVQDNIPVAFDLPISQQITVTLTENTTIRNAIVGVLSVPTSVTLPAGTQLPIQLDLTVPVQTVIPVTLNVPVDIPLRETELHQPFIGLQDVVRPFNDLLQPGIKTPADLQCGLLQGFCEWFFITP